MQPGKMKIINLTNAPKVPFNVDGREIFSSEKACVIHLCLKPGESVKKHSNPFDVFFYVLKGSGILEAEAEPEELHENDATYVKANILRGWTNHKHEELKILAFKIF